MKKRIVKSKLIKENEDLKKRLKEHKEKLHQIWIEIEKARI